MTAFATVPIAGALGASAKAAIDFESAMADVNKVTGLQGEAAKAMGDEILALSRDLPIAATGLAEIAAAGGQLGVATEDLGQFTESVAQMATAFDMSAEEAGTSIAKMMNLYSLGIDGAVDMGDAINQVSNNSSAAAGTLVNVATRIGGMATGFGLAHDEAVGLAGAFVTAGGTAETAGTSINSFLQTLQTATLGNETFQQGLEATGISAEQLEAAIQDNAVSGIDMFLERLNQLDAQTRAKSIAQMFGKGQDSALISKLAGDLDLYRDAMDLATDATARAGSMQAEFDARAATTANQMQTLRNRVTELGINIGSVMLPAINGILESLAPLVSGMADFAKAHPGITQVAVSVLAVVAAVGPLLIVIGSVISAVGTIIPVVAAFGGFLAGLIPIISTIGTVMALVFGSIVSVVLSPLTLLVAGVVAAVAAIIIHWERVRAIFASAGAAISSALSSAGASVSAFLSRVSSMASGAIAAFANIVASAAAAGAGISAGFMSAVGGVASAMASIVSTVLGALSGLAGQAMAAGARIVQGIASGIASGVGAIGSAMSSVGSAIAARLPGSPVKEGILVDTLNGRRNAGYRAMQMVASGLENGKGLLGNATDASLSPVALAADANMAGGRGGNNTSTFSPNVTININGAGGDATAIGSEVKRQVSNLFAQFQQQQAREDWLSYSS